MLLDMKTQYMFRQKYVLLISHKGILESYLQLLATDAQFPVQKAGLFPYCDFFPLPLPPLLHLLQSLMGYSVLS